MVNMIGIKAYFQRKLCRIFRLIDPKTLFKDIKTKGESEVFLQIKELREHLAPLFS